MSARFRAIAAVGWVFIAVGVLGVVRGLWAVARAAGAGSGELGAAARELWPMVVSGLVAVVGGVLVLRGHAAGRWVLAAWMAFHLVLSAMHDAVELAVHLGVFAVALFVLFRPRPSTQPTTPAS